MEETQTQQSSFDYVEFFRMFPHNYPYECVGIVAILIYIQVFIMGNTTNKRIALKFV